MNHLAHALLAGPDDELLLGSLLGDFWRGAPDPAWPSGVGAGVLLHRKIDVYTDSHPVVAEARALFAAPFRRYAGILIDIYFDHALARAWPGEAEPLGSLSARVAGLLARNRDWLPADLNRFAGYFRANDLFAAYAERDTIERVLAGVSRRLRHENLLGEAAPSLWSNADALDDAFGRFFPELRDFAEDLRGTLAPQQESR
jgi:acyl carrier protein phosphodiesterase